jgi:hypothetical protein
MDVTKRCSAEIKQAHTQFAGHMTKIIRKLSYTSDSIVACVTGQCGQLCKKHSLVCSGGRKAVWKAKFLPPGTKLHPNNEDLRKLRECIHLRLGPKALMKTRLNTNTQKCLFDLSTASLRHIHWKSCPYSVLFFLVDSGKHLFAKVNISVSIYVWAPRHWWRHAWTQTHRKMKVWIEH